MKISNNALNFLLAQYRAIFKRAYVKGIASAVLLTAGLAAGQAQAAAVTDIATINASEDETLTFDGTDQGDRLALKITEDTTLNKNLEIDLTDSTAGQYIKTSGTASDSEVFVLNGNGKNITITGNASADDKTFTFGSSSAQPKLQIKGLDTLTIDGAKVNLTTPNSTTNSNNNQVGVDVGAKNILITNGALVNLNNNTVSTGSNKANTILRGLNMEITGADTVVNVGNTGLTGKASTKNTKAVLGWQQERTEDGTVKYEGSNIKVSDRATINLTGIQVEGSFGAQSYHPGYTARVAGNSFTADNARIVVSGGASGGAMFEVHETALNNSVLDIKDGVVLNLEMQDYSTNFKDDKESKDANINYNGTASITGGLVKVDGALMVTRGGTLKIADDVALTAAVAETPASKLDGAIYVGIKGSATANHENTTLSTLELSSAKLSQFLNSDKETITDGEPS